LEAVDDRADGWRGCLQRVRGGGLGETGRGLSGVLRPDHDAACGAVARRGAGGCREVPSMPFGAPFGAANRHG